MNPPIKNTPPVVIGLGEILWDIFDGRKTLGGAPANFAYHARCAGAEGIVVSAIGNDPLGDAIESLLREKHLENRLQRCDNATGSVRITLSSDGVAHYVFPPDVAWDNIDFTESLRALAQSADAAAFGTLAQRSLHSRRSIRAFLEAMPENALRVCDLNLRQNFYSEKIIRDSLALADILKINEEELSVLETLFALPQQSGIRERCESFFRNVFPEFPSLRYAVITLGADGSIAGTRNGERSFIPAKKDLSVVDTVGAGDSFTATFTVALLCGKPPAEAHRLASERSEFVCSRPGAMP